MDMDFTPKFAKQLFEGEGGSYHSWSATEFPLLAEAKIGAGFLVLRPGGFALPHYADSSKIGYVLQAPEEGQNMPVPQINNANKWVKNIVNFPADIQVERAGIATSLTGTNFPFLEEAGLSCSLVKLEPNAVHSPQYTTVNMVQVFYVVKGSGKVQIVGLNSKLVLDTNVVAGQLLVVPRFFVAAIVADGEGIECFSIKTSTGSAIGELTSKESVFNVISPSVLQFSLNVKTEFVKFFKEKIGKSEILIPPKN
ncbi:Glutelin type-A [Melia azedarach]|uniref:Glutelin type-A n=2 Tax=Melia azedarach TaxID=155640 RepID=A0ACC1Y1R4_MELAZ|nr:Glutelin type-A [Melia azedarach]KAJ4717132.1 Glutelin type-A [Melia azedarach]